MNKTLTIVMMILITTVFLYCEAPGMGEYFPDMDGWSKKGVPEFYNPDNLYEYIDGAAEVFLSYDFRNLASLSYENDAKHTLTIDIYQHGNGNNGYGIYSQEMPVKGNFLPIGAQGYYEQGVLNFFKGQYYVKISSFDLGDKDETILTTFAKAIEQKIEGKTSFPNALQSFPEKDKIEGSRKYISSNFLGHSFLHSAFVGDYQVGDKKLQLFVIEAVNQEAAIGIVSAYREFAGKKGMEITDKDGIVRFTDPYYRSSGPMNIKQKGNFAWGMFCPDEAIAASFIKEVEVNLQKMKLID